MPTPCLCEVAIPAPIFDHARCGICVGRSYKVTKNQRLYENKQHRNPKRKAFVDVPCYSFSPEHAANDASRGDCRLWRAPNERDVASNVDISSALEITIPMVRALGAVAASPRESYHTITSPVSR